MGIKTYCGECEAQMVDGVMKHKKGCSAILAQPIIGTDYIRPPHQVIKFDTLEEQEEFMRKLNGSSGSTKLRGL